ncbi:MAG TPA: hypothetical protein PL051_04760 [Candidatus Saccharibacteria bacterium]|nr:hypothetical protein [Candidatus Saccharibacteria bacterium]
MSRHARPHWGVFEFWASVAVATILAAGFIIWSSYLTSEPDVARPPTSLPASDSTVVPIPTPSAVKHQRVCEGQQPFVPVRITVSGLKLDMPIDNLPLTQDGRYPVPQFNGTFDPRWSAARWIDNALACANDQGVVRLGLHTYSDGDASGNRLGRDVQVGAIVQLFGTKKHATACYEVTPFEGNLRPTWYNEAVPYDRITPVTGRGGVVLEFCWDKPSEWGRWLQHRYVVAKPAPCG